MQMAVWPAFAWSANSVAVAMIMLYKALMHMAGVDRTDTATEQQNASPMSLDHDGVFMVELSRTSVPNSRIRLQDSSCSGSQQLY